MNHIFNFPDLGEGLEEGTILEWYVKVGDKVKVGDPLVQMETDKVVADIPSPKNGVIVALHGKPGDVIAVGAPLAEIDLTSSGKISTGAKVDTAVAAPEASVEPIVEGEDAAAVVGTMEVAGSDGLLAASNEGAPSAKETGEPQRKALATPVARALAKEMGIDINRVPGSGPSGRVKREDILQFDSGVVPQPKPSGATENNAAEDVTYLPLTQIRKTIARNMLHAKHNAAHMSVFEEVEISALKAVIARYKPLYAERGVKLTYLPFIVKAVAQALKHHPQLNSQIDAENNRMIVRNRRHIAIAVDAPDGLVVPVIRDADRISIFEIATQIGTLAEKARNRKLTLEEMKEGSFSITSFGSIGGIYATPVINYPQAGILGIGRIMKTPIVKEDEIVIGNIMPLSLSVDHRIVDGGETTRFLARVMGYLSDPLSLMMDES
ncbi:2-oxo acid dehydrogenase subunit E2 [Dysgonomonadaceae bacterium zrk40]|nr:2-oxo acid dehydrogenase subunit E2 [Dysgonomonadaceae bacterium zrk40]